jgi:hypothetical protein
VVHDFVSVSHPLPSDRALSVQRLFVLQSIEQLVKQPDALPIGANETATKQNATSDPTAFNFKFEIFIQDSPEGKQKSLTRANAIHDSTAYLSLVSKRGMHQVFRR